MLLYRTNCNTTHKMKTVTLLCNVIFIFKYATSFHQSLICSGGTGKSTQITASNCKTNVNGEPKEKTNCSNHITSIFPDNGQIYILNSIAFLQHNRVTLCKLSNTKKGQHRNVKCPGLQLDLLVETRDDSNCTNNSPMRQVRQRRRSSSETCPEPSNEPCKQNIAVSVVLGVTSTFTGIGCMVLVWRLHRYIHRRGSQVVPSKTGKQVEPESKTRKRVKDRLRKMQNSIQKQVSLIKIPNQKPKQSIPDHHHATISYLTDVETTAAVVDNGTNKKKKESITNAILGAPDEDGENPLKVKKKPSTSHETNMDLGTDSSLLNSIGTLFNKTNQLQNLKSTT